MILIALTNKGEQSFKHYINVHNINSINDSSSGGSSVYAGGDTAYKVTESKEEIFQMIAEALQEEKLVVHHSLDSNQKGITIISKE